MVIFHSYVSLPEGIIFFPLSLRWWALCTRNVNFPAFCECESILGRKSKVNKYHVCLSFPSSFFILQSCPLYNVSFTLHSFLFVSSSFPVMFLSCCIHFLSCSIATYQTYRYSKGDMLKPVRWVSAQMLALFSYVLTVSFCYCFAIGLKACAGCHLQGS